MVACKTFVPPAVIVKQLYLEDYSIRFTLKRIPNRVQRCWNRRAFWFRLELTTYFSPYKYLFVFSFSLIFPFVILLSHFLPFSYRFHL
jgi:hypothetical protein